MKKTKSATRRALLMSVLSLIVCLSMLVGTTFAWFTDSVTSGTNKIAAGNLDVELYHTNSTDTDEPVSDKTPLFDEVTLWEPGAMVWEKLTVKNVGSLALKYTLSVNVNDIADVDGKSLADVLKVAVLDEQPNRGNIKTAELQSLETFALKSDGALAAQTGVDEFYVAIYWAPSANDNDYNIAGEALNANLGVTLLATQYTSESDSFDNSYDNKAVYDADTQLEAQPWRQLDDVHTDTEVDGGGNTFAKEYQEVKLAGNADITIKGVTFQNGLTIYTNDGVTGTITLENCTIYLNDGSANQSNEMISQHHADCGLYLGAISENVTYVFKNCRFTAYDNHTYHDSTGNYYGFNAYIGGNYSAESITFDGCKFDGSAKNAIGCSFNYNNADSSNPNTYYNLTVTNCDFIDWNNNNLNGAAIRGNVPADVLSTYNKSITITNNRFGNSNNSNKQAVVIDGWENGDWN